MRFKHAIPVPFFIAEMILSEAKTAPIGWKPAPNPLAQLQYKMSRVGVGPKM